MEDRAKYALIGFFTFAVIAGAFGFVYWLHQSVGSKESASYRVIFDGSISGLRIGAPVLFNGYRVGEVTDLRLTDNPGQVAAMLAVNQATPVRADTRVTLEYAGLTGIASVSLKGGSALAQSLQTRAGEPATLKADLNAGQDMSQAVRETLSRADAVIAENQEALRNAIKNLETFTTSLARNGDNIDKLMANSTDAMTSFGQLADNLDRRTADITLGVNKLTATATKQIDTVGGDAHRALIHIDKAVTDLANNPQRILFGGGNPK
jgi:phospholipid/cholesterol/gamma-HCH transport system substrate-binding protein